MSIKYIVYEDCFNKITNAFIIREYRFTTKFIDEAISVYDAKEYNYTGILRKVADAIPEDISISDCRDLLNKENSKELVGLDLTLDGHDLGDIIPEGTLTDGKS